MKPSILLSLGIVVFGLSATAQRFTLVPQIGIENSRTSIQLNNLPSYLPLGSQISPYLGARLNYATKKGHGAYVSAGTSHSTISYDFSNPETARNLYTASAGNYKLDLQAGYQFSSKPIFLNKKAVAKSSKAADENMFAERGSYSSCRSRCEAKNKSVESKTTTAEKGWYVSVQPSIGAAFIPSTGNSLNTKTATRLPIYNYIAGNREMALVSGVGFEFGKNIQRKLSVSVNYLKGISNLDNKTIVSGTDIKPTVTNIKSSTSAWSIVAGIPITLGKKKPVVKQPEQKFYRYYHQYKNYNSEKTNANGGRCGKRSA